MAPIQANTRKELMAELDRLDVKYRKKATKAELEDLIVRAHTSAAFRTPDAPAGESVKATLYRLFTENPSLQITEDELIAKYLPGRKVSSIRTWLGRGGLGSEKYGMKVGGVVRPILIERDRHTGFLRRIDVN